MRLRQGRSASSSTGTTNCDVWCRSTKTCHCHLAAEATRDSMQSRVKAVFGFAALTLLGVSCTVTAQTSITAADGVYTTGQAQRGRALYEVECQACHGAALTGALGPPLAGPGFLREWDRRPLAE